MFKTTVWIKAHLKAKKLVKTKCSKCKKFCKEKLHEFQDIFVSVCCNETVYYKKRT